VTRSLDLLLEPRSVAVIGASADATRLTGRPVRYLLEKGFQGRIYPINPSREEVQGLRCYPSVSALPETPDVAYVLIPATAVPDVVDECGQRGVPFVVISSSGFAEIAGGEAAQRQIVESSKRYDTAIVGPNCEGIWNVPAGVLITFGSAALRDDIRPGPISIVSQSGSLGAGLIQNLLNEGLGVNHFVSTGNEAGLDALDFLAYLVERDDTKVIVLFVEGLHRGARLLEIGRRAHEREKVILALKSGASEAGGRANASHTGRIASEDAIYDALFRQAGVLRLPGFAEVRTAARAFQFARRRPARGVAMLSLSGGARALFADAAEAARLPLPPFSERTDARLRELLPAYAIAENPADLTADVISRPELLADVLETIAADEATDAVVLQLANQGATQAEWAGDLSARLVESAGKTAALSFVAGLPPGEVRADLEERGVLLFDDPAGAAHALGWLSAYERMRRAALDGAPVSKGAGEVGRPDGWDSLLETLAQHGVPLVPSRTVSSDDDVRAAVAELGAPVALKLPADEVEHKTEHGGVRLGLRTPEDAVSAFRALVDLPGRTSTRAHVQRMVGDAVEVVVSVREDPDLGGLLAVGPGGVLVELIGELAYRVLPVNEADVRAMLDETRLGRLLAGFRSAPAADAHALAEAILGLVRLFDASPWLREIELNPLMVLPQGEGALAVDVWADLR
jgi:acyl-CoA synthetase (NDP forming)